MPTSVLEHWKRAASRWVEQEAKTSLEQGSHGVGQRTPVLHFHACRAHKEKKDYRYPSLQDFSVSAVPFETPAKKEKKVEVAAPLETMERDRSQKACQPCGKVAAEEGG